MFEASFTDKQIEPQYCIAFLPISVNQQTSHGNSHQQNILEVFGINDLVLVLFEKGVEVIKLVILLNWELLL